jgi:hypothetical protein
MAVVDSKKGKRTSFSTDITENIRKLREAHPDWDEEKIRRTAIAAAERAGGKGPPVPRGFRVDSSTTRGFRRASP